MKIAFLKKRYTPFGGAEKYLSTLINFLKQKGYDLHVLSSKWIEDPGVTCHEINTRSLNSVVSTLSFNRNVVPVLRRLRPDCIISFERTTFQHIYRAGDGCHREWLNLRGYTDGFMKRISFSLNPLHRVLLRLEKEIFEGTPVIIANSGMVREQIMRYYCVAEEKIRVIYNGVNLRRFNPGNRDVWREELRVKYSIPEGLPVILFVGSDFRRKGLGVLISSLPYIDGAVRLLVVGRGDTAKYKRLAARRGVDDRVIFAGPRKDIEKYYAASDVFVLPTVYDPFSNATIEAMASGLPVITTMNNGVAEIIEDGYEGYVLKELFDPPGLGERISEAIARLPVMSLNSRRKAQEYPIEETVNRFAELIEDRIDSA